MFYFDSLNLEQKLECFTLIHWIQSKNSNVFL